MWHHMYKTTQIMIRVYAMYNPMRIFFALGTPFFILGLIGLSRFMYFYMMNPVDTGKIQSLVISGVFLMIAIQFYALGII
jgi:multisubunit Na+/H+ antiporter MnhG subunit